MRYGFAFHFLALGLLIGIHYLGQLPLTALLLAGISAPVTLTGAAFPDIDHHSSRPHRYFKSTATVAGGIAGLLAGYHLRDGFASAIELTVPALDGAVVAGMAISLLSLASAVGVRASVVRFRPRHRGTTHRVPTGTAVSLMVGAVAYIALGTVSESPAILSGVVSFCFFSGFLSHLICDGMMTEIETFVTLR